MPGKKRGGTPDRWDMDYENDWAIIQSWSYQVAVGHLNGVGLPITPNTRRYLTERLPYLVLAEAAGPPKEKP